MCLPQGEALLAVGQLLVAQSAAERTGAALDGRLAAAMAGADLTSVLPPAATGAGRWSAVQRGGGGSGGGAGAPGGSGAKGARAWGSARGAAVHAFGACICRRPIFAALTACLLDPRPSHPLPLQPTKRSAASSSRWRS